MWKYFWKIGLLAKRLDSLNEYIADLRYSLPSIKHACYQNKNIQTFITTLMHCLSNNNQRKLGWKHETVWKKLFFYQKIIKVINHCIFRNLKSFLYREEHRMYFCNCSKKFSLTLFKGQKVNYFSYDCCSLIEGNGNNFYFSKKSTGVPEPLREWQGVASHS